MGRVRRCDSRCHNAKKPRCRCWCGGHFHGAQGAGNREALVQAVTEADQALLLQQYGFKEGETKYVQQLEKPKPLETVIITNLVATVENHETLLQRLEQVLSELAGKDWTYDFKVEDIYADKMERETGIRKP